MEPVLKYSNYILVSREHTWLLGLCDVVSSREIWLYSILELRPRNEIYRKVLLKNVSELVRTSYDSDPNIGESDREVQRVSNQLAWKRKVQREGLRLEPEDDESSNRAKTNSWLVGLVLQVEPLTIKT